MGEPRIGRWFCCRAQVGHGIGDVGGIPEHDRGDDEVEPGGARLLRLCAAVGDPALRCRMTRDAPAWSKGS